MTQDTSIVRRVRINSAFKPSSPINAYNLFAGRTKQMGKIVNAVTQTGLHVILYGERGVGKTSLVTILKDVFQQLQEQFAFVRTNCDKEQDFSTLWRRVLHEMEFMYQVETPSIGFGRENGVAAQSASAIQFSHVSPENELSPDDIRLIFQRLPIHPVVILDEVDRIKDPTVIALLADTIKTLSDHASPATLILVGVADSVEDLVGEHKSIERALTQVHLPRMSSGELGEALDKCLNEAQMSMTNDAKELVVTTSRGLPHYTHLLGLHSARVANENNRVEIKKSDVDAAMLTAIEDADQTIRSSYIEATHSSRKETMHELVLLACALSKTNELGYFTATDVKHQIAKISEERIEISVFARHLTDFSSDKRGNILYRTGRERGYRYRFINPLMQPYVIMKGIERGAVKYDVIKR